MPAAYRDIQNDAVTINELVFVKEPDSAVNLSHGTFGKIDLSRTNMKAVELLADGYAFAGTNDGQVVNGYVNTLSDVKVIKHDHDMTTGACPCGLSCTHPNGFTNGKCPDCGMVCAHTNLNEDYYCPVCQQQMVVKIENSGINSYGTDLSTSMNEAEDGTTVTLLKDTALSKNVYICGSEKTVTLNLNGHSVDGASRYIFNVGGTAAWDADKGGILAFVGKGDISANLIAWNSGTFDLSGWTGENLKYLAISEKASVIGVPNETYIGRIELISFTKDEITQIKLSGGSYGEIGWINFSSEAINLTLGKLLAPGYAFQMRENDTFVPLPYAKQIAPSASVSDVRVVKCTEHADADGDGKCDYCNGQLAASILDNVYTDLQEAFDALHQFGINDYLVLLKDADGSYKVNSRSANINLNGHSINGELHCFGQLRNKIHRR